ncbi:MAG: ABC transporter substrate-binding protein [Methanospirillum sp.]|uniref:ABC transporter substrate-binding protein n=1 Tax=Methanospirillum sp. TaxID=45200 RepID=UPI0023746342|nr:ABC transporter substrate-binding protein [Methanospirillum sp.]MDD1728800.1 ABC transporter substrate-binding protein [Methanospirillum sp.]
MNRKNVKTIAVILFVIIAVILVFTTGCVNQSSSEEKKNEVTNQEKLPEGQNSSSGVSQTNTSSLVTIRANVNKDCAGTPWFVGEEKGFFLNGGINFVDQGALDWSLQPAALISGQTDVADAHPNTIINLLKSSAKVKGVVAGGDEPEGEGIENIEKEHMHWLVLNTSPYYTIQDLVKDGKKPKIAVGALGICADLENNYWFRKNNLTKDDFEYVIIPDPQQEQALRQGEVDVIVPHPPFFTAAEQHGGVRPIATSREVFGKEAGITLLYFTEDFIKKNPDSVRKFINAYKEAERWSNAHPEESAVITAKRIGLDKSTTHYYSDSGVIEDKVLQKWIDAMVADGDIKPGEYTPKDLYIEDFKDTWET